ncbi:olfactory receptor 7G2-like [Erethizon dorsatum]
MEGTNQTAISEFLLLGLTDDPELQPLIFSLFLSMYLVTIFGNLMITLAVSCDSHLHTPVYFFLTTLSFNDICLSTTSVPHMLVNIQTQDQSISYTGCLTQVCLVLVFGNFESCLLAQMASDRYVAICHPLRYAVIMNLCFCALLSLSSLSISIMYGLLHSLLLLRLSLCTDPQTPHFFCELVQIIRLTCSDTLVDNVVIYVAACIFGGVPVFGIMFSYIHIVSSILRMPSSEGKYKAFSTCGSHLSVITVFYGTGLGVYISSLLTDSSKKAAVASVMYSVVPQMMNPFIYSLRNRNMKVALWKLITRTDSLLLYSLVVYIVAQTFFFTLTVGSVADLLQRPKNPPLFRGLTQLIRVSCSDTSMDNTVPYAAACTFAALPLFGIIFSYTHPVSCMLRMPSSERMYKTISTYGSHMSVVTLFYRTGFEVYINSAVTDSPRKTAVDSVMYSVVPQMLSPFIYSLRNKDTKEALRRLLCGRASLL